MDKNTSETDNNSNGMHQKRKMSSRDLPIQTDFRFPQNDVENIDYFELRLALSPYRNQPDTAASTAAQPPPPPSTSRTPFNINQPFIGAIRAVETAAAAPFRPRRARRNPSKTPPAGKSPTVQPAFPWSDENRATVRSLSYLRANQISVITGDVQCKKCELKFTMELDLEQRFREISTFIAENKVQLFQRAPKSWSSPALPSCGHCNQENCVKPEMSDKKRSINWLFLFLSQLLGCCTLEQLKYFCKHTKNHRTGAKDRVLFLAYLALCKQLDPNGPYDL